MDVRRATPDEIAKITTDPLTPYSLHRYAVEKDGVPVAYFGLNTASYVSEEGYPWVFLVDRQAFSNRKLALIARNILKVWSAEYPLLLAVAEKGVHEAWFKFLGFTVDKEGKPFYDGGKTMVYMRYTNGK